MAYKKIILAVLDGFGIASPGMGNAISSAEPPFFKELIANYPTQALQASGPAVGLPWGDRGSSEVGHLNIGAGRVVAQELPRINQAIADGSFYKNPAFLKSFEFVKKNNSTLHIAGLIGSGKIHAYEQHLYTLLGMAVEQGVKDIAVHAFTDGRDSPPKTALSAVEKLEKELDKIEGAALSTLTGRFYAMDRGEHWEQTKKTIDAMVDGQGESFFSGYDCVVENYNKNIFDEMVPPCIIVDKTTHKNKVIKENDAVIFFNYRNDRMIQLVKALAKQVSGIQITTMTLYNPDVIADVAFMPVEINNSLGEIISKQGWKQFHIAESEKYAHVTFFFNGHRHEAWPGEERKIIKSPATNGKNYEDVPQMSAPEVTNEVVKRIVENDDAFILVNYANGDMVGHTGSIQAAQQAVLALDESLKRLAEAADQVGALLIITADHGNCEAMVNFTTGEIEKEHSANPVPIIFYAQDLKQKSGKGYNFFTLAGAVPSGILPDIAPTILNFYGLPKPVEMTGSVIKIGQKQPEAQFITG